MMLIWLKAIKTGNKTRKDLALIVTMCSSWENWPLVQQQCLLMSLYSTLIFNRKQGQEMCIGLGMLEYILRTDRLSNRSRNPAAGWICFGPGLTNPGPSKTQTNFLVDNKQFLSQQAARLREDRLCMLFKRFRRVCKGKVHPWTLTQRYKQLSSRHYLKAALINIIILKWIKWLWRESLVGPHPQLYGAF